MRPIRRPNHLVVNPDRGPSQADEGLDQDKYARKHVRQDNHHDGDKHAHSRRRRQIPMLVAEHGVAHGERDKEQRPRTDVDGRDAPHPRFGQGGKVVAPGQEMHGREGEPDGRDEADGDDALTARTPLAEEGELEVVGLLFVQEGFHHALPGVRIVVLRLLPALLVFGRRDGRHMWELDRDSDGLQQANIARFEVPVGVGDERHDDKTGRHHFEERDVEPLHEPRDDLHACPCSLDARDRFGENIHVAHGINLIIGYLVILREMVEQFFHLSVLFGCAPICGPKSGAVIEFDPFALFEKLNGDSVGGDEEGLLQG